MTKAEIQGQEDNAKKNEQYIINLEHKYDDLLKEYLKDEKKRKNMKK